MIEDNKDMAQYFMWTVGILVTVIITLIGFIVGFILKSQAAAKKDIENIINSHKKDLETFKNKMESKVDEIKKAQDEIKFNYLKRFESVNNHINAVKEEIVEKISELRLHIVGEKSKK